jgi:hypothetical protein
MNPPPFSSSPNSLGKQTAQNLAFQIVLVEDAESDRSLGYDASEDMS